jgi:hypothetical protein
LGGGGYGEVEVGLQVRWEVGLKIEVIKVGIILVWEEEVGCGKWDVGSGKWDPGCHCGVWTLY